jgi:flagellar basal body rod protein FlgG
VKLAAPESGMRLAFRPTGFLQPGGQLIKGIYTSAFGMMPRILKQAICANNFANINTSGFKDDDVFMQILDDVVSEGPIGKQSWEIPMVDGTFVDYSQGDMEKTDNNFNTLKEYEINSKAIQASDDMSEWAGNLEG